MPLVFGNSHFRVCKATLEPQLEPWDETLLKGSWDLVRKGLGVPFKGTVGFYNGVPFKGLGFRVYLKAHGTQ